MALQTGQLPPEVECDASCNEWAKELGSWTGLGTVIIGAVDAKPAIEAVMQLHANGELSAASAGVEIATLIAGRIVDRKLNKAKVAGDIAENLVTKGVSNGAGNVNAQSALRAKLSGLEKAQQNAATTRQLPDGRVRYYTKEVKARSEGPTRGASFVTEHNPKNGNVRQWMESYDHSGQVNRVHPKSINGQTVNSQHYPPTAKELGL
ncbi:hypothetical protein [Vibrio penaeicida]|uniref:hypothetical protein n=1 Tax=Vibrio penaeicida TaxID=104609 RepID=UPI002732352E|nr:hypothetical protein [Vibrio penaeicida]